jgi:uncharacterized flavoprotein (TIGR03862 family)
VSNDNHINIVGAGPTGLFCSFLLLKSGYRVTLYDQMSGVAKKFLVAGNGGLNLTHSEKIEDFSKRYGENSERFLNLLKDFSNDDLRNWCKYLGFDTFVGTSGRVFPKEFKAAQLLSGWLKKLKSYPKFDLKLKTKLIDIEGSLLTFSSDKEFKVEADYIVLALGGSSWKKTGSDGLWVSVLNKLNLDVKPFGAINCGFETSWSDFFKSSFETFPIKNVVVHVGPHNVRSEMMITKYGVEGSAIYALSREIQNKLEQDESTVINLDLFPDISSEEILKKISVKRPKVSRSNHLRKALKLNSNTNTLIKDCISKEDYLDDKALSRILKSLPIKIENPRPIDEAISTSGGVSFSNLSEDFSLKTFPNIFIGGEMLDWDAPTGGYLLQGCFSIAYKISKSLENHIHSESNILS